MRKKLKDSGGLTMVETLCAVVILVLLCLMLNSGLSMAVKAYYDITAESETQLLLSSLSDALTDKLRYCVVYTDEAGTYQGTSIGDVTAAGGRIVVKGPSSGEDKALLPEGAYGKGRYKAEITEFTTGITGATPVFTIKLNVKETSGNIGAETRLTIRCLNPVKEEVTPP